MTFQRAAAVLARLNLRGLRRFSVAENCSINDSFGKAVHIDASRVENVNLNVETKWQENCNINVSGGSYTAKMRQKSVAHMPVVEISSENEERVEISADIPEQNDLMITGSDVQLQLKNKVRV